jgi:hypothetical protein
MAKQSLFLSQHVSESGVFAHPPIRTKANIQRSREYEREKEAFNFPKVAADHLTNIDEFSIFGQMVASQLRKLNRRNQAIAKNYFQNYLFHVEMSEMNSVPLDNPSLTPSHSVTPSSLNFPCSFPKSCQSVDSNDHNTHTKQLHDTTSEEIQD